MSNLVYDTFAAPRFRANGTVLHNVLHIFATWQNRARTRRHQRDLDARLLDDAGIAPADAMAEAAKPFWRA